MTKQEYIKLVNEDLEWLLKQPRKLERDHIEAVLKESVNKYFPEPLASLTDEELKSELKRRKEANRQKMLEERANKKQCKTCKHFGTIRYWGGEVDKNTLTKWDSRCCPFKPYKNGKRYLCLKGYEPACEHYEKEGKV